MRHQRSRWVRFFESKLFFVVGLFVLVLLSINLTRAQFKDRSLRVEIQRLQEEVNTLEGDYRGYETLISMLATPAFLEKEARESLGYVKPGEEVVVIEESEKCLPAQAGKMKGVKCVAGGGQSAKEVSNPKKWWVYFFVH